VTNTLVLVGSADGHLYALERRTGNLAWKVPADGAINSSPAVAGSLVYFTSQRGTMYAVALADGRLRWSAAPGASLPPAWAGASGIDYYGSSPVVHGDLVFAGAPDGVLYAFDRFSGSVKWRGRTEGRIHSSPAVGSGIVVVGSFDGSVYAFDLVSGARRWRFDTTGRGFESEQFGFDRRSIVASPALTDSTVFIGSRDGHLYAIDLRQGTERWRVSHDGGSWSIASPGVDDSLVYDASSDARFVHALRASTGERLWRVSTPGAVWSSPALAGHALFLGDGSGSVHAIDRANGRIHWSYRTGGPVMSSPSVSDGVLYVGSADGAVYALRIDAVPLERAVYWDSALATGSRRSDHLLIRDALTARGYAVISAADLPRWLEDRILKPSLSVMVLATDQLPAPLASPAGLIRRYLDAGGKLVSPGDPPFIWPPDQNGEREYAGISRPVTSSLLQVDHMMAQFDRYGAHPTALGIRWGLRDWWLASWSIPPGEDLSVLAQDERGLASVWVRSYGGAPGTGFIQFNRQQWNTADVGQLVAVAEYRPDRSE
jgi:outer membrane protein assembly factor BamB